MLSPIGWNFPVCIAEKLGRLLECDNSGLFEVPSLTQAFFTSELK
jgi:hypothetical protein